MPQYVASKKENERVIFKHSSRGERERHVRVKDTTVRLAISVNRRTDATGDREFAAPSLVEKEGGEKKSIRI